MANGRPLNHVEIALREAYEARGIKDNAEEPSWTREQIEWMEKTYPPRCFTRGENFEDHLRYAGYVEFVQARRAHYDQQSDPDGPDEVEHV